MTKIENMVIKPGHMVGSPLSTPLGGNGYVELKGRDGGILLYLMAPNDTTFEILPGNTAFAGGTKYCYCDSGSEYFIYLESGPYVTVEKDGRNVIKIVADDDEAEVYAIQLD